MNNLADCYMKIYILIVFMRPFLYSHPCSLCRDVTYTLDKILHERCSNVIGIVCVYCAAKDFVNIYKMSSPRGLILK